MADVDTEKEFFLYGWDFWKGFLVSRILWFGYLYDKEKLECVQFSCCWREIQI